MSACALGLARELAGGGYLKISERHTRFVGKQAMG